MSISGVLSCDVEKTPSKVFHVDRSPGLGFKKTVEENPRCPCITTRFYCCPTLCSQQMLSHYKYREE